MIPKDQWKAVRPSAEASFIGSITYMVDNNVFRASKTSTGMSVTQIFSIDKQSIGQNSINDILVHRDYAVVKFSNDTFYIFLRTSQNNIMLSRAQTSFISLPSVQTLSYTFASDPSNSSNYILYASPGFTTRDNLVYQHVLTPKYSNGVAISVNINLTSTINIKDFVIQTYKVTSNLIVLGCIFCNNQIGKVNFYERQTFTLINSLNGNSNNIQFGSMLEGFEKGKQTTFYIGSNSAGQIAARLYYLSSVQLFRGVNGSYSSQVEIQNVRSIAAAPQNGMIIGFYQNTLILKYFANKNLYSIQSCDFTQYFQDNSQQCVPCQESNTFQLAIQNTKCNNCSDVWYSKAKNQSNDYQQAMFSQQCSSFDPTKLFDYDKYANESNGGTIIVDPPAGNSSNGTSSDQNVVIIVIAIVIPIVLIIVIILIVYFCCKKCKQKKEQEQIQNKNKKKEEQKNMKINESGKGGANASKRNNRAVEQSQRIQKKMDRELYNSVKQQEEAKIKDGPFDKNDSPQKQQNKSPIKNEEVKIDILLTEPMDSVDIVSEERDDVQEIKKIRDNRDMDYQGLPIKNLNNKNLAPQGVKKDLFYSNGNTGVKDSQSDDDDFPDDSP
ncbi:UNKNOWN [Stylonychia lemnae]|uniref:Transmembrane protein n=1 Tax=Stylonychia lemnae TaxID=5949 RepID=A0A078AEK7_STYLE|nr:UNKNOWN [Stylonychia lemnae]|eukprot:CDW79343.1 UNKNOWN [Stylonychia lemnae]